MISKIGIKLADGTFFPILDENASSEHTLELTTVREHQESVQINLFKKAGENEPEYIGSLIVEEIADGTAGEPTINLKIKLDEEKNLSAEAVDEGSGSKQSLKVSLKTLNTDTFDVPDFDLSAMEEINEIGSDPNRENVFIPETETDYSAFTVTEEKKEEEKKKGFPLWAIILLIILCIGALVFAILLLTKKLPFADKNKILETDITSTVEKSETKTDMNATTSNPPKEDTAAKEAATAEAKRKAEEAAAAEAKRKAEEAAAEERKQAEEAAAAEAKRKAEEAAAAESQKKNNKKTPKVNADGSVRYKIKWGDTLWDLSESFYKTPWKYKKIADYNKIKNPNLIISGTYIDIPPK